MPTKKVRFSILAMLSIVGVVAISLTAWRLGYEAGAKRAGSNDLMDANVLSLDELQSVALDHSIFYQGSNDTFHFVRVDDIGFFRLRCSDVTIPLHGFEGDGSSSLGMIWKTLTIEDGKLKASGLPTGSF